MAKEAVRSKRASTDRRASSAATQTRKEVSPERAQEATNESVSEFRGALEALIANEPNSVRPLWQSLDDKMQHLLAVTVGFYIGRWSEEQVWFARDQRGYLLKKSLTRQIRFLERALQARLRFEKEEVPHWGFTSRLARATVSPLSESLLLEMEALKEVHRNCQTVFSKRRLGGKRTHNLVLLQLYVGNWMVGRKDSRSMTIMNIADLVDLARRADGKVEENANTAEKLAKDLPRFTKNAKNACVLDRLQDIAWRVTSLQAKS